MDAKLLGSRGASPSGTKKPWTRGWKLKAWLPATVLVAVLLTIGLWKAGVLRKEPAPVQKQQPQPQGRLPAAAQQPLDLDSWVKRLTVPWGPMLTQDEAERGITYWGSGRRMRQLARKLINGRPIKVFTLGGSVTCGVGTTETRFTYARRVFEFIAAAFPHRGHVFINRGVERGSAAVFAACAEHMVPADADLVILEFSSGGDRQDAPYSDPERRAYEQLVRKLLALKNRPALIQLHHYAWWNAVGDGVEDGGLFYQPAAEAQLGVFAHYYDFPSVSVRAALWHLMRARLDWFIPDVARAGATASATEYPIPGAVPFTEWKYWYNDRTHPGNEGHIMISELLSQVLVRAVWEELAPRPIVHRRHRFASIAKAQDSQGLLLPMFPGNVPVPTTLCARETDFEELAAASSGFEFKPEKPGAASFLEQKWGWTASKPGAWLELEFDTEASVKPIGNAPQDLPRRQVGLVHLKSFEGGMGTADVKCVKGCTCEPQLLDGTSGAQQPLDVILQFWVSRHKQCRVRVTVSSKPGAAPQKGHKVWLLALMVSHFPANRTST